MIKEIRGKLNTAEFAVKLNCTESYVRMIEQPKGNIPSKKIIKQIAAAFGGTPDKQALLEKNLLDERTRDLVARTLSRGGMDETDMSIHGMPLPFINELKKDISVKKPDEKFYKATISKENLEATLQGRYSLTRKMVIALAKALNKPPDRYLDLADLIPDNLKGLFKQHGLSYMFRSPSGMTVENLDDGIEALSRVLSKYLEERSKKRSDK